MTNWLRNPRGLKNLYQLGCGLNQAEQKVDALQKNLGD